MKYMIPLYSGIGNIIQSVPFANEMKKRYGSVFGFNRSDFPEALNIVKNIFDKINFEKGSKISSDYTIAKIPDRRSCPEYKTWFIDNNEEIPSVYSMDGISFSDMPKHKYVVWPECKPNWLCKRWPYFYDLIGKLDDVALVGLETDYKFKNVTDYRGKLSLMETGGVLKNADVFIGNEGGMGHYAAALGTKTYVILGCSDPVKSLAPYNMIGISLNLECQPCQFKTMLIEKKMAIGCHNRKCLNDLLPEKILREIL